MIRHVQAQCICHDKPLLNLHCVQVTMDTDTTGKQQQRPEKALCMMTRFILSFSNPCTFMLSCDCPLHLNRAVLGLNPNVDGTIRDDIESILNICGEIAGLWNNVGFEPQPTFMHILLLCSSKLDLIWPIKLMHTWLNTIEIAQALCQNSVL